jgi:hypothetical protein
MADRNNNLGNSGRSDDSINNPDLDRDQSGMSGSSRDRSPSDRSSSNLGNQSGLGGSQRDRSQTDEIIGDESTSESGRSGTSGNQGGNFGGTSGTPDRSTGTGTSPRSDEESGRERGTGYGDSSESGGSSSRR